MQATSRQAGVDQISRQQAALWIAPGQGGTSMVSEDIIHEL